MNETPKCIRRDLMLCGECIAQLADPDGGYMANGARLRITSAPAGNIRFTLDWRGQPMKSAEFNIADVFDLLPRLSKLLEDNKQ